LRKYALISISALQSEASAVCGQRRAPKEFHFPKTGTVQQLYARPILRVGRAHSGGASSRQFAQPKIFCCSTAVLVPEIEWLEMV